MTNQGRIQAVGAALQAAFPAVEQIATQAQDSAVAEDPTWLLTVRQPQWPHPLHFRCGRRSGWMWDAEADIPLPPALPAAIKLANTVVAGMMAETSSAEAQ